MMFRVAISTDDGPYKLEYHLGEMFVTADSPREAAIMGIRNNLKEMEPNDGLHELPEEELLRICDAKEFDLRKGFYFKFQGNIPGECHSGSISAWPVEKEVEEMKQLVQQILDEGTDEEIAALHHATQ